MLPKNYKYGDGSATDNRVKQIIPILIKWSRESWDKPHYYAEIANIIGSNPQSVGGWLGLIWSHVIHPRFPHAPSLNALVCNQDTDLPSDGLDYVFPDYSKKSVDEQKKLVDRENLSAHNYDWNPVLRELGLKPLDVIPSQALTQYNARLTKKHKKGGESYFHKNLKEYIQQNPDRIGVTGVVWSAIEQTMLSQDRIDVLLRTCGNTARVPMPCLNIKLGEYRRLGDHTAEVPKYRNWNGQIHSFAEVMQLYIHG